MRTKPIIFSILGIIVAGALAWVLFVRATPVHAPTTNEHVAQEGLVRIFEPPPNAAIASPLTIRGEARGTWYFEASFPVILLDANGNQIAIIPAQAQSDWMTEEFVPFETTLVFDAPPTETGTLVFRKDNPSGLPEHDDAISIPIRFN